MLNHASSPQTIRARRATAWALTLLAVILATCFTAAASAQAATHRSRSHRAKHARKVVHRKKHTKPRTTKRTKRKSSHKPAPKRYVPTRTTTTPKTTSTPPTTTPPTTTTPKTTSTPPTTTTPTTTTTTTTPPPTTVTPVTSSSSDPLASIGLTSAATTSTDPSGAPMPTGNLPGWSQVYSDNFSTSVPLGGFSGCNYGSSPEASKCSGLPSSVSSQLAAYNDGWSDTSGHGTYEPSQVLSIHDNMLDYYMHTSGSTHMVAAVVPKIPDGVNGGGLKYGAYAIRFKSDDLPGYKTAFLLWPDTNEWPLDGEIDFPEGDLNSTIGAYMHEQGATSGSQQNGYSTNDTYSSWHTAVIEWTPNQCRFILDGQVIGTSYSLIPNTPMHWVLQAETSLSGAAPSSSVAGHIYIAWITAYAQS